MAAGSVVPKRPPSSSQAPGSSSKQQKTPTTAQAVPKTAAKVVPALTEKKPAAQPEKSAPEYTAAPMSTIDLSMLKESRFLMPPAMLPYRDEVGRISLHLLRDSQAKVNAGELKPPEEIGKKISESVGGLIQDGGAWLLSQFGQTTTPLSRFARQKSLEAEPVSG